MDHDLNVVGALAVALGDRMRDATEEAAGMSGALPAALASLHEWAGGRTIDTLAGGLRLSHSRTVRVIDRLAAEGLATRERDRADGRGVLVRLTPAGERAGAAMLAARDAALAAALSRLESEDRRALAGLAEQVLEGVTTGRRSARSTCRLCESHACGHDDGRCPVTRGADAAEASASAAH
ncbi:MAG TPA: MarR family transcriptional regulator [Solirubrobacteraceae bacterium]|nr:MarR family transcriptional regulator [Solirubrobacteraceae bacterium]